MLYLHLDTSWQGLSIKAGRSFRKDEVIYQIEHYQIVTQPSHLSIQVEEDKHIHDSFVLAYLNHSCNPNVLVNVTRMELIALHDIDVAQSLTCFYPSTEWIMARPFHCRCGSDACLGYIDGAKNTPREVLCRYFINAHIRRMIDKNGA